MISLCRLVSPRVNRTGNSDDPTLIAACRPGVAPLQCWPDGKAGSATRNVNGLTRCVRGRCPEVALLAMGEEVTEARPPPVRFRARHVSMGEPGGKSFRFSFDGGPPSDDALFLPPPDHPYLLVQRRLEDEDGG